jgi:hypothetical protein
LENRGIFSRGMAKVCKHAHPVLVEHLTRARKIRSRLHRQQHVVVDRERRQYAGDLELEAEAGVRSLGGSSVGYVSSRALVVPGRRGKMSARSG